MRSDVHDNVVLILLTDNIFRIKYVPHYRHFAVVLFVVVVMLVLFAGCGGVTCDVGRGG